MDFFKMYLCVLNVIVYGKQNLWHAGRGNVQATTSCNSQNDGPEHRGKDTCSSHTSTEPERMLPEGCKQPLWDLREGLTVTKTKKVENSRLKETREMKRKQIHISTRKCTSKANLITEIFVTWVFLLKPNWAFFPYVFATKIFLSCTPS